MFPIRDHNPSHRVPYVTWALIAINVAVFLYTWPLGEDPRAQAAFLRDFALFPRAVTEGGEVAGLFTSMFLHAGLMHLGGNMLYLFIFGDNVEDRLGHLGFLAFYIAGGVAAGLAHVIAAPVSMVPTVGASGAIAAVLGGYLLLYPRARVDVLLFLVVYIRVFTLPALVVLGVWFGLQIVHGAGSGATGGGVAYWAHAGGFVAGVVLMLVPWLRGGGPAIWRATGGRPEHAETRYPEMLTRVPVVRRRR